MIVKQKRQASAAFLGVLAFPINVVRVCCILTTIFRALALPRGIRHRKSSISGSVRQHSFANQPVRENTDSIASDRLNELGPPPRKRPQR
jgi:hypothetical protein